LPEECRYICREENGRKERLEKGKREVWMGSQIESVRGEPWGAQTLTTDAAITDPALNDAVINLGNVDLDIRVADSALADYRFTDSRRATDSAVDGLIAGRVFARGLLLGTPRLHRAAGAGAGGRRLQGAVLHATLQDPGQRGRARGRAREGGPAAGRGTPRKWEGGGGKLGGAQHPSWPEASPSRLEPIASGGLVCACVAVGPARAVRALCTEELL
jgi:hypothetical protein